MIVIIKLKNRSVHRTVISVIGHRKIDLNDLNYDIKILRHTIAKIMPS